MGETERFTPSKIPGTLSLRRKETMVNDKPVVYIPQEPMRKNHDGVWVSKGLNLAATSEFGIMCIVWPPNASILYRAHLEQTAKDMALKYREDTDYVVALGSPTLIAMMGWAIGNEGKVLRMLEWDRGLERYYPTLSETV